MKNNIDGTSVAGIYTNLKIRTKVMGGFMALMAVLIIVSGIGYFGFEATNREMDEYSNVVEEAALVGQIETEFLKLQNYANEFANRGRKEDAEMVKVLATKLSPQIELSLALINDAEMLKIL